MTLEGQPTYFSKIDIMRILACIAVVVIHVTATPVVSLIPNTTLQIGFLILNRLAKPSVPIFIFISGYLAYRPESPFKLQTYLLKLRRLALPYIVWTCVYYALFIKIAQYPISPSFLLKHLFVGDMVYHLYFMIIIIQFSLLTPILIKLSNTIGIHKLFVLATILQFGLGFHYYPYQDRIFLTYIAYYVAGFWIRSLERPLYRSSLVLSFIFLGTLYTYVSYLSMNLNLMLSGGLVASTYSAYSLISCFALFVLIPNSNIGYRMKKLSKSTEFIYYAHPLMLMLSSALILRLSISSISGEALLSALLVFFVLTPIAYVVTKSK